MTFVIVVFLFEVLYVQLLRIYIEALILIKLFYS